MAGWPVCRLRQATMPRLDELPAAVAPAALDRGGVASLRPLFRPRAIAVIGVSRQRAGLGRRILRALRAAGFPGAVHAITRDGADIDGAPSWSSVRLAPGPIDVAVIAVP